MKTTRSKDEPDLLYYCNKNHTSEIVNEFFIPEKNDDTLWVHITPSTKGELKKIIESLNIHTLAAEAIATFSDSPRMDVYSYHTYISTFIIKEDYSNVRISILLGDNYVITHEEENDLQFFSTILEDFQDHPQHMSSPGHILYHILDHVSEYYLQAVDAIADEIQELEKSVFKYPFANEIGHEVYNWKGKIHSLRQVVEAQESVINDIGESDSKYINEDSAIYLKTLGKNFERVVSAFDTFIETLTGIFDLQMSLKSDHMNSIMKTLTLVSVIFIPMTFIAGLYGMNFENMPELTWNFGYGLALVVMFGIGISIALFFRSKGWWGKRPSQDKRNK